RRAQIIEHPDHNRRQHGDQQTDPHFFLSFIHVFHPTFLPQRLTLRRTHIFHYCSIRRSDEIMCRFFKLFFCISGTAALERAVSLRCTPCPLSSSAGLSSASSEILQDPLLQPGHLDLGDSHDPAHIRLCFFCKISEIDELSLFRLQRLQKLL